MNHKTKVKLTGVFITGLIALAVMVSTAFGATYNLRASTTTMTMPDGASITMWGFALVSYDIGAGIVPGDDLVTVPGPRLTVPAGQGLTVNLTNELPDPVSIIIPGQNMPLATGATTPQVTRNADGRIRSFTHETPVAGGPVSYIWSNIKPGTYLYHSGTHPAVQVQMGLYGAVTKNELDAPATVYGQTYDAEVVMIYSEIDPALHAAVTGDTYGTPAYPSAIDYHPKYFMVNGVASDATSPIATIDVGSKALLRLLNAGLKDHAPEILGSYVDVIAEDGNLYPFPKQKYSLLLAAGKTLDAVLTPSLTGNYPIFDRRLYRTKDPTVQGAMHTYITVQAAP